jgi:hypothetical protein
MAKTIELIRMTSLNDDDRIQITSIDVFDFDDDIDQSATSDLTECFHRQTSPMNSPTNSLTNIRTNIQINWTDIPEINNEQQRHDYIVYIQRNSRMIFAGIIDETRLNDEYLKEIVGQENIIDCSLICDF